MKAIVILLSTICMFCMSNNVITYAQEQESESADAVIVDQHPLEKINSIVQKIYDEIIIAKGRWSELANFDEKCLSKNEAGFSTITYEMQVPSAGGKTSLYAFKLDVEPISAKTYVQYNGYYNFNMPLLDLQFAGYVVKHPLRRQFDLEAALNKFAQELADYQQQFMPLRFFIIPENDVYHIGEPIYFKVILANTSKYNILVNELNKSTLYFTLNNAVWGTSDGDVVRPLSAKEARRLQRQQDREARAKQRDVLNRLKHNQGLPTSLGEQIQVDGRLILKADQALTVNFVGEGYDKAQDIEIRGIYQLNIKGLKPTAKAALKIVE
ncbi:MAG: hypothetical protein H6753_06950 [Candidatus Omnitrophica bacterium]|nr:hypothetical protein [Candidatus Omnitrophota bacterium]